MGKETKEWRSELKEEGLNEREHECVINGLKN
jgi:hypothetical protein